MVPRHRFSLPTLATLWLVTGLLTACVLVANADDARDVSAELEKAKQKLAPTYTLAYKATVGESQRTKVTHLATVETTIKGATQTSKSRTVSTRSWRIKEVEPDGSITFENIVEHVEMWNSVTGRDEVRYDSATDKEAPPEFAYVAKSLGKVLATIKIDAHGRILARQNAQPQFNPGIGELTIPFPGQPVKAGQSWSIPEELQVRLEDGTIKKVQTQQKYRLEKVEAGVATIAVETQVLTPVNDPKVQSQLVQRLQRGTIKFDVDAGRLLHKQMDADEEVYGFSGPDSHMQFLARFTEEPAEPADQTAKSSDDAAR